MPHTFFGKRLDLAPLLNCSLLWCSQSPKVLPPFNQGVHIKGCGGETSPIISESVQNFYWLGKSQLTKNVDANPIIRNQVFYIPSVGPKKMLTLQLVWSVFTPPKTKFQCAPLCQQITKYVLGVRRKFEGMTKTPRYLLPYSWVPKLKAVTKAIFSSVVKVMFKKLRSVRIVEL